MNIIDTLKNIVCEINIIIEKEDIPLDKGLLSSDIIDSFGFVELVAEISDKFNIEIDEEDINPENFKNLVEIKKFIERKMAEQEDHQKIDLRNDFEIDDLVLKNFVNLNDDEKLKVLEWRNDDDTRQWMYDDKIISKEEHFNYIEQLKKENQNFHWMISTIEGESLGVGCFHKVDFTAKNAEMEIYMNPGSTAKNVGFRIGSALIKLMFEKAGFHNIFAETIENNKKIRFLLYYLGFKKKGTLKDYVLNNGKQQDVIILELPNESAQE